MNFFKSKRSRNQSKRFPTRELESELAPRKVPSSTQKPRQELRISIPPHVSKKAEVHRDLEEIDLPLTLDPHMAQGIQSRSKGEEPKPKLEEEVMAEPEGIAQPPQNLLTPKRHSKISSSDSDFDLRPPAQETQLTSLETLSQLLYSEGYLRALTSDTQLLNRFCAFLNKYKPDIAPAVAQYLETQKVQKAVDYANAVADALAISNEGEPSPSQAVELSQSFLKSSERAFNTLLKEALPAWVTYSLVKTASSCLTAEITNHHSTPLTRDLFGGLSEVFCISDPKRPDNPLVYASEEFFRLSGYSRDSTMGRNCRFLQGPKTKPESRIRLAKAITEGEEICETLLNYRRDGTPFLNLLLLAPLYDTKGNVKYFLGAQVDASRLITGGRGVDGFERYLLRREMDLERFKMRENDPKENVLARLRDLGKTFDLEESAVVQDVRSSNSSLATSGEHSGGVDRRRNIIRDNMDFSESSEDGGDDDEAKKLDKAWKLADSSTSGRLPGLYQKYVLIRPYPSLRMIFVSYLARKLGKLQQRPLLSHLAAPASTINGLKDSFRSGTPVTAKVAIIGRPGMSKNGTITGTWRKKGKRDEGEIDPAKIGKTCWISATPLVDANGSIGVWMVVIVDKTGQETNMGLSITKYGVDEKLVQGASLLCSRTATEDKRGATGAPIKPKRIGDGETTATPPDTKGNAAQKNDVDAEDEEAVEAPPENHSDHEKSQRSSSTFPDLKTNSNGETNANPRSATESPSGSPAPNNPEKNTTIDIDDDIEKIPAAKSPETTSPPPESASAEPKTPTRPNYDPGLESTPKTSFSSRNRDVGLRAMDYLSSRSSIARNLKGGAPNGDTGWNDTPYSVD